jgi:hypothetical protein
MSEEPGKEVVVVRVFSNTLEADLASSWLEAEGVEFTVLADDAGGTYPFLQVTRGVKLLVRAADEDRAKEILDAAERESETEPDTES